MIVNTMTIELENFENAAMVDNRTAEVVRMLRQLADRIEENGMPNADGVRLMDTNGNQVGSVAVDWEEEPEVYDDQYYGDSETVDATYGGSQTPCQLFTLDGWYVVEDSCNVNRASDPSLLVDGVDIETLDDCDTFTTSKPVADSEELEKHVWEFENL